LDEYLWDIIVTLIIFVSVIFINTLTKFIIKKVAAKRPNFAIYSGTLRNGLKYFVWAVGIFALLKSVFGVGAQTIITALGVGGLALTLAMQSLIKDFIMGAFVVFEGQLRIGDEVTIKSLNGIVEVLGLRTTRIRGANGDVHIFNNSELTVITNHSRK